MTIAITSLGNTLSFPIQESEVDLWESTIKEFGQKSLDEVLNNEALKKDLLDSDEFEVWDYFREDFLDKFLDTVKNFSNRTDECEAIIDDIADDLAGELSSRLIPSEEDQIKVAAQTVFEGLSHEAKMDLIDQSELIQHFIISTRIEDEYLKTIKGNEFDEVFVCKISNQEANKLQGQLRQYAIDRAKTVAVGLREIMSSTPDADRELRGCEHFLEIAEGFLNDFNINPESKTNSEVIYWESFRDYFAFAVSQLTFNYD